MLQMGQDLANLTTVSSQNQPSNSGLVNALPLPSLAPLAHSSSIWAMALLLSSLGRLNGLVAVSESSVLPESDSADPSLPAFAYSKRPIAWGVYTVKAEDLRTCAPEMLQAAERLPKLARLQCKGVGVPCLGGLHLSVKLMGPAKSALSQRNWASRCPALSVGASCYRKSNEHSDQHQHFLKYSDILAGQSYHEHPRIL
jgi:hypothetical protein